MIRAISSLSSLEASIGSLLGILLLLFFRCLECNGLHLGCGCGALLQVDNMFGVFDHKFCGGQISPRSTRRQEGLAWGLGLATTQGLPFVGRARTTGGVGRPTKGGRLRPRQPVNSCAIHSNRLTFPRMASLNIEAD
jgi:hypothetical protein